LTGRIFRSSPKSVEDREERRCKDFVGNAHHPEQLAYMELSLAASVLAKIQPERIINFMTLPQLRKWRDALCGS
jgi:hypothetical protein